MPESRNRSSRASPASLDPMWFPAGEGGGGGGGRRGGLDDTGPTNPTGTPPERSSAPSAMALPDSMCVLIASCAAPRSRASNASTIARCSRARYSPPSSLPPRITCIMRLTDSSGKRAKHLVAGEIIWNSWKAALAASHSSCEIAASDSTISARNRSSLAPSTEPTVHSAACSSSARRTSYPLTTSSPSPA